MRGRVEWRSVIAAYAVPLWPIQFHPCKNPQTWCNNRGQCIRVDGIAQSSRHHQVVHPHNQIHAPQH
ncbi:hypothetical protein EJ03DRAFT_115429 [Teratosphaeria nubilosa]|uniref:Uncharacterized protein n=1 Tax=Teratosphaeria nubilosa TaxID=161662 RepID=A0A6G1L6Z9_9PEZI|nr:hypothetical protein EJ03DRAFT_115429 [Teratosphaeria nubilosa]